MNGPEFDRFSASYDELLRDPIRDRFADSTSPFFHLRKRDLIRNFLRQRGISSRSLSYLDFGCGRGELLSLLRNDFARVAGCDLSRGMLSSADAADIRAQDLPNRIPFTDAEFDFVTAVCVYHHLALDARLAVTQEIFRVLKPGGIFAMVEHNPYNPVTRYIVSRAPIDVGAVLLKAREARQWMSQSWLTPVSTQYFLYLPEMIYRRVGSLERLMSKLPLGGQYVVFAKKVASR